MASGIVAMGMSSAFAHFCFSDSGCPADHTVGTRTGMVLGAAGVLSGAIWTGIAGRKLIKKKKERDRMHQLALEQIAYADGY
ncbi:MAG: hypothetical protein R3A47_06090 [Polyangiales bacterium]